MKQSLLRGQSLVRLLIGVLVVSLFSLSSALGQFTSVPRQIYLKGPTQVCAGMSAEFHAYPNAGECEAWSWDSSGGNVELMGSQDGTDVTIVWNTPGQYRVTLVATCQDEVGGGSSPSSTYLDVTVVAPPANQFITVQGNQAANITPTSATICPDRGIVLMPPSGATNCVWSSNSSNFTNPANGGGLQVNSYGSLPGSSATYTLRYQLAGPCPVVPISFTVNVATNAGPGVVTGTERFGAGPLTLTVQNYQPTFSYTWYDDLNSSTASTAVTHSGEGTFTIANATQSRSYYLAVTSCEEGPREEVKITLRQVRILVNGQVPTRTVTGTSVVLQADPSGGQYTWLRDGQLLSGATGPQLTVTEAGSYTVRLAGGTGPAYESFPVDVLPLTQIKEWTVLKPNVTNPLQVATLGVSERGHTVTYVGGLGQPIQQLGVQAGPEQEDVVQHIGYEGTGTTAQTFLPFPVTAAAKPSGDYETDPLTKLNAYYASRGGLPFSTATAEASPLGRPLEQTQTGQAWAGHSTRASYATNAAQEVRRWQGLDGTQWYAEGQLFKEIALDPDDRRTEIFKDQLGRVVLQRKLADNQQLDTYTVYADAGYVLAVIPPEAVRTMGQTGQWNIQDAGFKDRWLYQYVYDDRGRVVERKFPGATPVYLVYDPFDRPVLVQDGNRRVANQWLFTKFDAQNRPVVEGLWQDGRARAAVQAAADQFTLTQSTEFETRTTTGYTTTNTFPSVTEGSNGTLLSLSFYDDYDLNNDGTRDYDYQIEGRLSPAERPVPTAQTRGLTTVTRRRVVQPNGQYGSWLTTAVFYDEYGNVVQKQGNNLLQANAGAAPLSDVSTLVYRDQGFVPQVLKSVKKQEYGAGTPVVVRNRFAYDPAGRLLQTWQQHEWKGTVEPEVLLSSNRYTGLGELTQKKLHSRDQGAKFLQSEDFAYNQHGQLISINNGSLKFNQENDLFGMVLHREQTGPGSMGNTPRYDGGISAVSWMVHNEANAQTPPERERSYRFAYDGLGRLNAATYAARINPWEAWTLEQGAYDEKNITYDANGNLLTVERWSQASTTALKVQIDDLFLYYGSGYGSSANSGNRLLGAYDYTGNVRGFKLHPAGNWTDYAYDANGSLTHDGNKGVDYTYNALNKVERQTVGAGSIASDYDAGGTVVRKVTTTTTTKTEYYLDGFVYEYSPSFTGLRSVPTPEGRAVAVQLADTKLTYEYHLRDHLDNLRVAFRAQAGTKELRLSSEDPAQEEGAYPKFENVAATRSQAVPAYHGSYVAAVTRAQNGPAISIPVSHGDHLKVRVRCNTPYGVQYYRTDPPESPALVPRAAVALAPALLPGPAGAAPDGRSTSRVAPGLQVSLSGLLSGLISRSRTKHAVYAAKPAPPTNSPLNAYLAWTLLNDQGQTVRSGYQLVPVYSDGQWRPLDLPLDIDLSSEQTRTGTLRLREVNDASNPVFFDSLTITRPQDRALISQENHYYPFGMALSGVAINTQAQPQVSKDQFNGGSELQDELLGAEQSIYSTYFRNYDPATGRFQGLDPLADKYAALSPYLFSSNDPINFNDPIGDEPIFICGRLMNPRDIVTGRETWEGSALEWQAFQQGGPGITFGGKEVFSRYGLAGFYEHQYAYTVNKDPGSIHKENKAGEVLIGPRFVSIRSLGMTDLNDAYGVVSFGFGAGEISRQIATYSLTGLTVEKIEKSYDAGKVLYNSKISNGTLLSTGKLVKNLGKGLTFIGVGIAVAQYSTSDHRGEDMVRLAGSLAITASGFIPLVGPAIAIGLSLADSYGAFDRLYQYAGEGVDNLTHR